MKFLILAITFTLLFLFSTSAFADSRLQYNGLSQGLLGLNGVVTSIADPIMGMLEGDSRLGEPPFVAPVTNRIVGLLSGSFCAVHRVAFGAMDMAVAIFPMTHISPDPRFIVIPGTPRISAPPAGF